MNQVKATRGVRLRTGVFLSMGLMAALPSLPAAARPADPADAAAVLARAKEAAGGKAWDRLARVHSRVHIETGGMAGEAESWEDLATGRHATTYALGPITGAEGFDGKTAWSQDPSGQSHREEGGEAKVGTANDAYRTCMGYWYPDRWPATIVDEGTRTEEGRGFRVLTITPRDGRPFELWIDATTWLFDRMVEKTAIETRTTLFSDYERVEGVMLPHATRITNGTPKYDQVVTVLSVEVNPAIDDGRFAMPAPPQPDYAMAGGATSVTVPFELVNNHIYVDVLLNGKGPFRVLCDTGGQNVITPTVARALGLESMGAMEGHGVGEKSEEFSITSVDTLALGAVTLQKQLFAVFPLEPFADVEGTPQSGLVGYEIFKRFVVTIDYEHERLTLTLPAAFTPGDEGVAVPFHFNGSIPQVEGSIDGIAGKFDIDTGSRASLSILGPFAEKNGLEAKLKPRFEGVTGWGVGGAARGRLARAKELRLGDASIAAPVTELSLQKKGAFTDPYVAGNVGAGILKRFTVTFDYAKQRMILEPNANHDAPDVYDRSGMWINRSHGALDVVDVIAGGPADGGGLQVGDRIVSVDGEPVADPTLLEMRARFRHDPPGTRVRLTVESGGARRDVTLVLADLI